MSSKSYANRISELEQQVAKLISQIKVLSSQDSKYKKPHSTNATRQNQKVVGNAKTASDGVVLPWNNVEAVERQAPGTEPTMSRNEHGHSRFSGGALDINTFELVEYDVDWETEESMNKHNRGLWPNNDANTIPPIKKIQNEDNEVVEKIGNIDWVFNANAQKWGSTAYGIDVKNTYFIEYDKDGKIALDANEIEKKAPLWNADPAKTSLVWDPTAKVWRIYAVYKD